MKEAPNWKKVRLGDIVVQEQDKVKAAILSKFNNANAFIVQVSAV